MMGREPLDTGYKMCDPGALIIGQTLTEGRPHGKKGTKSDPGDTPSIKKLKEQI